MTKTKRKLTTEQKSCGHNWGTGWNVGAGGKMVMQVRRCQRCDLIETRKDPTILKEKLNLDDVASNLAHGWRRYVHAFGVPPLGTVQQIRAMLELSYVDQWRILSNDAQEGKATE